MDFQKLDKIYQEMNFSEDAKILEILNEHRNLEAKFVPDEPSVSQEHTNWGVDFHKEILETIDYLIENIDNGYQKSDALIYLYPYMIHRYSNTLFGDFTTIMQKFEDYLGKLRLTYNLNTLNIGYIYTTLMRFFSLRMNHSYSQEFVDSIVYVNDNNWGYAFKFCSVLLYDKKFCRSVYYYEGAMHSGAFILFDTLLFKIFYGRNSEKQILVNKYVDYFEKNNDIQFGSISDYYLVFAKLIRCAYLSFDKNNINDELKNYFNTIELPAFEAGENTYHLYLLYNQKLNCLENFNESKNVLDTCDYLLRTFEKSDKNLFAFIIDRINWRKYNALKLLGKQKWGNWFFEIIGESTIENIRNSVYFSPFMEQDEQDIEPLYHFSDLKALESIIEKKTLWLTRYDFLNDIEEIRYIAQIIEKSKDEIMNKDFKSFIEECLNDLNLYFDDKSDGQLLMAIKKCISNIYVLSTSTKDDNLSLWHYYSGGIGCSIKMEAAELRRQFEDRNTPIINKTAQVFMRKIEYTDRLQKSELLNTLQTIFTNEKIKDKELKKFLTCIHIIYEGIFTKNLNMSQEQEFRVAVIAGDEPEQSNIRLVPKFRVSKNTFIPYIELNVNSQTLIKEICIAPLNKTDIAKKGLQEFLKSKGFVNNVEMVKISGIKLRY